MTALAVVLLKVAIVVGPLAVLARATSIYPTRRLVLLLVVPWLASLGLVAGRWALVPLLALDALVAAVVLRDLLSLPGRSAFSVTREAGRIVSLGRPHPVALALTSHAGRAFRLVLRDGVPHELHPDPAEFALDVPACSRHGLHYVLRAGRRGAFTLSGVHVRVTSRRALWHRYLTYSGDTVVHVYPDLQQLGQYALMARTNRLSLLGVRRARRIGTDNEFSAICRSRSPRAASSKH